MDQYTQFSAQLSDFNKILKSITGDKSLEEYLGELDSLKQAELQANLSYFIQDLVYILLNLRGVDTTEHPISNELNRIKLQFQKIKHAQNPQQKMQVDKPAADRFIKAALQLEQQQQQAQQQSQQQPQHIKFDDEAGDKTAAPAPAAPATTDAAPKKSAKNKKKRSSDTQDPPNQEPSASSSSQSKKSKKQKKTSKQK
ncbi:hypothetical protein E3P99_04074 [Wallemia hederae]|uniref:Exosome complex protein n=1 Tax=Wallemia hederae TaxID=1540922 RepID=A0A4T0FD54_9BASI|nr:hypothetical protein E3P99_04074 [Wallemia hederae]